MDLDSEDPPELVEVENVHVSPAAPFGVASGLQDLTLSKVPLTLVTGGRIQALSRDVPRLMVSRLSRSWQNDDDKLHLERKTRKTDSIDNEWLVYTVVLRFDLFRSTNRA